MRNRSGVLATVIRGPVRRPLPHLMALSSPGSPTLTASSSFDMLSSISHSLSTLSSVSRPASDGHETSSDDEIVWDISETSSLTESSLSFGSDDDFIVLSRPRSPSSLGSSPTTHSPPEDYETTYRTVVEELSTIDFNIPPPIAKPPPAPRQTRSKAKATHPKAKSTSATTPKKVKKKQKQKTAAPSTTTASNGRTAYPSPAPSPNILTLPPRTTPKPSSKPKDSQPAKAKKNLQNTKKVASATPVISRSTANTASDPPATSALSATKPKKAKKKEKKQKQKQKTAAPSPNVPTLSPQTSTSKSASKLKDPKPVKTKKTNKIASATPVVSQLTALGTRPIVDDVSEGGLESDEAHAWGYDEAKKYISSCV